MILREPIKNPIISQVFGVDFAWFNHASGLWEWFYKETYSPLLGHPGIDYKCSIGTPIYSAHDGVCLNVSYDTVNGNLVQIWNEAQAFKTLYGHNSKTKVKQGDIVKAGQLISLSGNTGAGTGPHLHFGLKLTRAGGNGLNNNNGYNGAIDPQPFIKEDYLGKILNIINKDMNLKKVKGEKDVYLVDDIKGTKTMIVDVETLTALGGKFQEVDNLAGYIPTGTLVYVDRVIN